MNKSIIGEGFRAYRRGKSVAGVCPYKHDGERKKLEQWYAGWWAAHRELENPISIAYSKGRNVAELTGGTKSCRDLCPYDIETRNDQRMAWFAGFKLLREKKEMEYVLKPMHGNEFTSYDVFSVDDLSDPIGAVYLVTEHFAWAVQFEHSAMRFTGLPTMEAAIEAFEAGYKIISKKIK